MKRTRPYNETTEFYVNELPRSCSEDDCPFNYDTIACRIIMEDSISEEQYRELCKCLNVDLLDREEQKEYNHRPSCCPLRKIGYK
jgi:hypothetical protein